MNAINAKGDEFVVNDFTTSYQGDPAIAANPKSGGFQIVWESSGQDGEGLGVYGRNFDSTGVKQGSEFGLSTITEEDQSDPDVVFNEDGNGAWIWQTEGGFSLSDPADPKSPAQFDGGTPFWNIHSRTFGFESETFKDRTFETHNEERVRLYSFDDSTLPRLISLGGDNFASVNRLTDGRDLSTTLAEFIPGSVRDSNPINGHWSRTEIKNTVTSDLVQINESEIVVLSTSGSQTELQIQTFTRKLLDSGQTRDFGSSRAITLNDTGQTGDALAPRIDQLKNGNLIVSWTEQNSTGSSSHLDAYVQVVSTDGTAVSGAELIHRRSEAAEGLSEIAVLRDGGFVVVYSDLSGVDASGSAIVAQRFNSKAQKLGDAIVVNQFGENSQSDADVATLSDGTVVVTWESSGVDGDSLGVSARLFEMPNYGPKQAQKITGTAANERISAGAKNDLLDGVGGNDTLLGGLGNDTLLGGANKDLLTGGNGRDLLSGNAGADTLLGGKGNDELTGNVGNDSLSGQAGQDFLNGSNGNDTLIGGNGSDTLNGGNGRDVLEGGQQDDVLTGGKKADLFVFNSDFGVDRITDFNASDAEKIDLSSISRITGFRDLVNNHLSTDGDSGAVMITVGLQRIILDGLTESDFGPSGPISADDFLF